MKITRRMSFEKIACSSQAGSVVSRTGWHGPRAGSRRRQKKSSGLIAVSTVSVYRNPEPSGAHHWVSYQ